MHAIAYCITTAAFQCCSISIAIATAIITAIATPVRIATAAIIVIPILAASPTAKRTSRGAMH